MPQEFSETIDPDEITKFNALASAWWNPEGKFKPLHQLNPCRLDYINAQIATEFNRDLNTKAPFKGLHILDIGCGGGLLCEPMARLGANVIGIDSAARNIPIAQAHALQSELNIDYRVGSAEQLAAENEKFDIILNMEVIEHVANPEAYVSYCAELLKSGGIMILSTLNRTAKSFTFAIIGAEYVLRWLPRGTHEWKKFITPTELETLFEKANLKRIDICGMVFDPLCRKWRLRPNNISVNYATTCRKL